METYLVFNIEPAAASDIRALDNHIVHRTPDGTSAIDLDRTPLNQHLHGDPEGPSASLAAFYKSGVKRPTAQAESPYLRIVISASPAYFRPWDPEARGTWDPKKMEAWRDRSIAWLRTEFGDDLIYAGLHLDEDTPQNHAVVAPTYERKKRRPGKRRRNETEEAFEHRCKEAETGATTRTVGRASHPTLSKFASFHTLRKSLTIALSDLGIEYGEDRTPDAPDGISTREWVARQTVILRKEKDALAKKEAAMERERDELQRREQALEKREAEVTVKEGRLRKLYKVIYFLIGTAADKLGVGKSLREIEKAIRDYAVEQYAPSPGEPEDTGSSEPFP